MTPISEVAASFLASRRIAVAGASGTNDGNAGNIVYKRLRERGYDVVAVNPNATTVEGDACYPDLASFPEPVDAVVIATAPTAAETTVRDCLDLGITQVWMHRSFGAGSVDPAAAELGRANGVTVIEGGCPLMFAPTSDGPHRFLKHVCTWTGKVPRRV